MRFNNRIRFRLDYDKSTPPSTMICAPVMYEDISEAINTGMEQDSTPLVQEHSPKKTVRIYKVALFTGLLFVVIVLGVFLLLNRKTSSKNQSPSITPSQTPKITEVISTPTMQLNVLDAQNRLLFIRDPDPQAYNDYQAWVLYPDGREEQI